MTRPRKRPVGRPKLPKGTKATTTSLRLYPADRELLTELAEQRGCSESAVVREALAALKAQEKS